MADTLFTDATANVPGTPVISSWLNDVNTGTYNTLSAVAGTNTITAIGPLSLSAYSTFQQFFFAPTSNNTGPVTININGLGAKNITKNGNTPLVAGDLVIANIYAISYDGTQFQVINPSQIGRLIGVQTFIASGTYTPTLGTTRIYVRGQGSGGAGAGCQSVGAGQVSIGGGGGAGAYGEAYITSGFSGTTVTIGSAGAGAANANGNPGLASSFGAFLTLAGGQGGLLGLVGAVSAASGGAGGAAGGTALLFASAGESGTGAISSFAAGWVNSGRGGGSIFGSGGMNLVSGGPTSGGAAATGRGAGGGGAGGFAAGSAAAGGSGTAGVIIIYEYA